MRKSKKVRFSAVAVACALVLAMVGPVLAFAALQTNYGWYKGHESDAAYEISTAGELKALANLVNGTADYDGDGQVDAAVSFEGKTITLTSGAPANFLGESIDPIGTQAHPFQGTFDGTARQVDNFKLAIPAGDNRPVCNIGLFGYVGPQGKIVGVSIGARSSISIERGATSKDYIANVGMVAGYCAGTMANCSNAGSLTVSSEVVQQSKDDYLCVRNIGGVAGQCVYDMDDCSNTGAVSVSQTSSPVASYERMQLVARVGGVVGLIGDEERIGDYQTHIYGDASKHGAISGCANTGMVTVDTPKLSGLDRFGERANAESVYIGGVVGYSQGSVTNCSNGQAKSDNMSDNGQGVGYVKAENGVMVGGVCGSVRGVLADNTNIAWADDGADGNDPLTVSNCANYGDVYGRVTVGGIVGKTSSYTSVVECLNSTKVDYFGNVVPTYVVATRWNKPGPGGIVGTANGDVSYCANFGTVASAVWNDEASRTLKTQDGYYAAGVVGMLTYFDDKAPSHGGVTTPVSEVFSCYNAGTIVAGANMRQRGIVGQNDGFTHDNVLVSGRVYNDEIVYGDTDDEPEASGTVGENRVYSAGDLRGSKMAEAIAFLNGNSEASGWTRYWIVPKDTQANGLNAGYPLLNSQNPWDNPVLITDAATSLKADAAYTGGVSVPSAEVTLDGGQTVLTENVDFRVVPQEGAIAVSTGRPYKATVVGLGRYQGTASSKVSYDIVAGDFSRCTLTATAHTFDFEVQLPSADDVTVRTSAGTVVDPSEYTFKLVGDDNEEIADPVNADYYRVVATPKENSTLFYGQVEGTYRIKAASFMREVKFDNTTITYLGQEYPWVDSSKKGESDNPSTTLRYTGSAVKPVVGKIVYNGHELIEGTDYKVVYGNSNSDDGWPGDVDENNVGKEGGTTVGCVTVRYISGVKSNFTSYANMFFNIADDGGKTDIALARAHVDGAQVSDGNPIEPVEVWLDRTLLEEGSDYIIEYRDNVQPGTAHYMITGINQFTGSLEGDFTIEEGSVYELGYAFAGDGSASNPFEATVTGVTYLSSRPSFDMVIPGTVEHDGNDYTVTAIGDNAFGGPSASDFAGSASNESKMKLHSVSIPASVRTIGNYAFGTSSVTMSKFAPLELVEFGAGSELQSIGEYAFGRCESLTSFTVPAQVSVIANHAFYGCRSLAEMRFLTEAVDLPANVGSATFYQCDGVVVRGFESAAAVKKLASDNANPKSAYNANGGRNFTFSALESLAAGVVSEVSDQLFTGGAVKPSVTVTLDERKLQEGSDYIVSYENNVNAGTARVVVTGIGDRGSQVVREFKIVPVDIGRASFARLGDQPFTGKPVELAASLTFNSRTLREGVDYDLSYADMAGNAISAPKSAGSYRLVVTGKGNFKGTTYRTFGIVAPSIADAQIGNIGDKPYAGGQAVEPAVDVRLGGAVLARDEDFTVAYENNADAGEAIVHIYGIGNYEGQADTRFRITEASLKDALVAGVSDVRHTGAAVEFDTVVVVGDKLLVEGIDYDVSYYAKDAAVDGSSSGTAGVGAQAIDAVSVGDEPETASSSAGRADADGTGSAAADEVDDGNAPDADGPATITGSQVVSQDSPLLAAQEDGESEATYTLLDAAPSDLGDYRLVITGRGNYAGAKEVDFSITEDVPAATTDLSQASDVVMGLSQDSFVYDATPCKPEVTLSVGGQALSAGVDYIVSYRDNLFPGSDAKAFVHGIGAYSGSLEASFTIGTATITAGWVQPLANVEYTGLQVCPHLLVRMDGTGKSLSEGRDYTVEYGDNLAPGDASATVKAVEGSGFEGQVPIAFSIVKADVSRAMVGLEYDSATYSGSPLEPDVTVTLGTRVLDPLTEYDVSYSGNTGAGTATVTIEGKGNCMGTTSTTFAIDPIIVAKPAAVRGLTYTGGRQTGVPAGVGYDVAGASSAVEAGTYTATVTLRDGYAWSGGFTTPLELQWGIAKASLDGARVSLSAASFTYNAKEQKPTVSSVMVGNAVIPASSYSVSMPSSKNGGTYKVAISGTGSCTGMAVVSYTIAPAAQKMVVKAKKPALKASKLKKAKQTLAVGKLLSVTGAKTAKTYVKQKGSSARLTIAKKTGKVTVKKGTKKGTYKLKVKVTAAATTNYKAASKTVTVKIRVK